MIDTHTHLNLDPLVDDFVGYFEKARESGVEKCVVPGVNFESSEKAVEIAGKIKGVYPAIGLHPHEAEQLLTTKKTQDIYNWLVEWGSREDVVAIGECGLDYFRLPEDSLQAKHIKAFQKKLFKLHIKASREVGKPLIVHVRDAQDDAIEILENYSSPSNTNESTRFILHCFSGNQEYLERALKIGGYISFAGNITFNNAKDLQELMKRVSLDRILFETDAPYLNPDRGQWPNTPAQVRKVYEFVSESLSLSLNDLEKQVEKNVVKIFSIG